ncbi:MAG: Cof-type HAD-IIB family hydrolase [Clostridia bacterium]|nr:Cof-type HAD-IIB family hydrolase [Clostridia bacterium]
MKKINKQLIVSDFDGTLISSSQTISDEVRDAIEEYVSCGGIFAVCTGRMLCSILPRVRELGLKGLVVAYQGTVIAEIESGKIIKINSIKYQDVAEICTYISSLNQTVNTYSGEVLYTDIPRDNIYLKRYEKITGVEAVSVDILMAEFVINNRLDCQKITCLVAPSEREKLYRNLKQKFGERFDVTCSADVLVEMSPLGDNKGEALNYIAKYYNIPMQSTVAIGDNLNDLSMIKNANIGVAVGNAVEELKIEADCVTVSNNEGAVAKIIKKYGFV